MPEFWENAFSTHEKMWGEKPTDNAYTVLDLFKQYNVKDILVPGFGYGRNAKVFHSSGMNVTGIEISETAIKRARKSFGEKVDIFHGSVSEMPFDNNKYDAVYAYSLLHLLSTTDRAKFIAACYQQLKPEGIMVFVALSTKDTRFGVGELVGEHTYRSPNGLNLYFYDKATLQDEFDRYHMVSAIEINEPLAEPTEKHWMVVCEKAM